MIEIGSLTTAFQSAAYSRKINVFSMFLGGLGKTAYEIKRKNWKLFLVIAVHYILTNIFMIYRILRHVKPLEIYSARAVGRKLGQASDCGFSGSLCSVIVSDGLYLFWMHGGAENIRDSLGAARPSQRQIRKDFFYSGRLQYGGYCGLYPFVPVCGRNCGGLCSPV